LSTTVLSNIGGARVIQVTNNRSSAFGWVTGRKEGYKNVYTILIDKFVGKSHTEDQEAAGSITLMRILREKFMKTELDGHGFG